MQDAREKFIRDVTNDNKGEARWYVMVTPDIDYGIKRVAFYRACKNEYFKH